MMDPIAKKMLASLTDTRYACSSLSNISGGFANFTYRGTLMFPLIDNTESSQTIIIKHAEPYIAAMPDLELDVGRSRVESSMLAALQSLPKKEILRTDVTTAKLYLYNDKTDTLVITDFWNSIDMKSYLIKYGTHSSCRCAKPIRSSQATRLGRALGKWLFDFHEWGTAPEQIQLTEIARDNPMALPKHHYCYGRLVETIAKYPEILKDCKEMFEDLETTYRKELESGVGQLIHGDFWTGNILLHNSSPPPCTEPLKVMIVDWEVAIVGSRAYDFSQLLAHLYMLTYFLDIEEGAAMIEPFMEGYGRIDRAMAFRAAIHFGMHFLVWAVPVWAEDKTEAQEVKLMEGIIRFGRDIMEAAYREDVEYFRGTVLHPLFFLQGA